MKKPFRLHELEKTSSSGSRSAPRKSAPSSGETRHDGTVKILGVGQTPSRGVRKGEIVDFDTAGKCVREALADAEEKSDVMIRSVYLGVTGGHIASFNNRGSVIDPRGSR